MSYQPAPKPEPPPAIIVCISLRSIELMKGKLPPYKPYTGSTLVRCPFCGDEMWLGPRSREKHEQDNVPLVCSMCAIKGGARTDQIQSLGNPEPRP